MPFNEPTDDRSQIQEFLDTFHGAGVQHLALHTSNIMLCLDELIRKDFKFLTVPATYYEAVPKRVPNVTESLKELARLGILVDGSEAGYLLQIFTEPMIGPFFFEFIQRKGDKGFGEGNFRALFEAIERDQIRRGVLT
jgi:4-hydroxyphenylpyruvate dioxygenase